MSIDAIQLRTMITEALAHFDDPLIAARVETLCVEPRMEMRSWDYGIGPVAYPCWIVLEHPLSGTAIAYCEQGFGPRAPWGLLGIDPDTSMGPDASWYASFALVWSESHASVDPAV